MAQVTLGDFAPVNKSVWAVNNSTETDVIEKEKVEGVVELQDDVSDIKTADYGAGVNVIDSDSIETATHFGIEFANQGKGVFKLNGTSINDFQYCYIGIIEIMSNNTYYNKHVFSVETTNSEVRVVAYYRENGSTDWVLLGIGRELDLTQIPDNNNGIILRLAVHHTDVTLTDEVAKLMLRSADITDSTYHPYIKTNQQLTEDINNIAPVTVGTMYDADNNAAVHNAHPRGKNITDIFNAGELSGMISSGLFDEIYPGDYFTLPMAEVTDRWSARTFTCRVMHLNPMKYVGDGTLNITDNHIGFATDESWFTCPWNKSGTTEGGYAGSTIHGRINEEAIITAWQNALSSKLTLMQARMLLSSDVNTEVDSAEYPGQKGMASNWDWNTNYFKLMSEMERYGAPVWSSGGFNTGTSNFQLAYYANNAALRGNKRKTWDWLSDIVSVSHAAVALDYGGADSGAVADTSYVRPLGFLKS